MGAEFTFVATSAASNATLYEAAWQSDQYWTGYLLPNSGAAPPGTISYADSLSAARVQGSWIPVYAGWYLFAPARPPTLATDPGAFIDSVMAYVKKQPKLNAASQIILWIPAVDPLTFASSFVSYSSVFTCNALNGQFATTSNLNAHFGQSFNFNILANVVLTIDSASGALKLSVPTSYVQGIAFQRGTTSLGIKLLSDGSKINAYLPFTGTNAGCCVFPATIQPSVTFGTGGLPLGFFYTATETVDGTTRTDNFSYPAFAAAALPATLSVAGTVDLLDPFNQLMPPAVLASGVLRTGFVLAAGVPLASCFSDVQGNQISLSPLVGASGQPPQLGLQAGALALTTNAVVPSDPNVAVPALTLTGQFGVNAAKVDPGQTVELLCGIFGSERISLTGYKAAAPANDVLLFCLGSAAYAPVFPFPTATLNQPDSGAVAVPLNSDRTTAWATVVQGSTTVPSYSAEPAGSPMFGFPGVIGTGAIILESQPPSLPVPQGLAHVFPLVPYAGLTDTGLSDSTIASFESTVLAATRKRTISAGATEAWAARASAGARASQARLARRAGLAVADEPPAVYRATPQGLIATVCPDTGNYNSVTLGQTLDVDKKTLPFGFLDPSLALQDALQTNQLFLVIVNPTNLVLDDGEFENKLDVAGWTMMANVGEGVSATAYANVMVMKYCSGSFASRIANPNQWTSQADFALPKDVDPESSQAGVCYTGLSSWLQDLVTKAQAAVTDNPQSPYANFVDVVNDPDWNGVLVLQATLDATSLPAGLAGIAAGIDMTQFRAHHFGFTASRVSTNSDGTITFNGNSSTFGLVDYANQTFAANLAMGVSPDTPIAVPVATNYAFIVLQLQSLFENSAIALFKSYIELAANTVFNTVVTSTDFGGTVQPTNAVVLDGSYIDQDGVGIYVFVQATPTIFTLDSNVLRAVAFDRVQFNCLGTIDDGATVLNRFLVWGHFDFAALIDTTGAPLDILSFGDPASDAGDPPTGVGLSFSSLLIDMTYPETTPGSVTFVENTQNLSYDLASSVYRADSLFPGFSLQLTGFIAATDGQKPPDFGYLTVGAPLNLTQLGDRWYGVTYNVTMGGPGALASAAGFSSSLLLAWSPASNADDKAYSVFTGLSLPGAAPGAKLISLQGVFKVAVDSIALSRQQVPDETDYYYCLRLDNIGVKILGIAKLPPDGNINFFLFGDPGSTAGLGWYAAYNRNTASDDAATATLIQ